MINYENKSKEIKNNIFFTYNDFNFVAVRKFSEEERAFVDSVVSNEQNKKLLSKNALYYAGFLESQKPVSEQNFEKALNVFNKTDFLQSSSFDADIFYCREKGTFYTALNNDFLVPLESTYISDRQEKELFENRFSGEIESFKNDNFDFLKSNTLSYELDEEKDFALMSDISDVLAEGEGFTRRNENIDDEIKIKLGDLFDKKNPEKLQPTGLRHLIKHRMEERLNNGFSMEKSQKETTAILFLSVNNIDKAPAVKEPNGKYAIYKDGIRTTIGKDKKGKFVVSGFDYADTKREATESIGTVIARYGYTPGFLEIYDQVGAVASELNIHKENSVVNKNENIKDFVKQIKTADQIIYTDSEISRVASLILQNGGSRVRLHDAICNRVINSHYDKNNLLSINNLQFSESKNNLKENIKAVKAGNVYIKKNGQGYRMIDADTKQEAADAIKSVNALYGYTPGFLEIYDQVGAAASELNIHKENFVVNKSENTNTSIEKSKISNITKFEYDGLTYIPVRTLSENEKELINNRSPKNCWRNSIIEKPKNGENYSIEDFKKKLQSQDVDLFYCIERGKFFTPTENGIINLNEGSIDEHFRKELSNFYNNENIQELVKNHRPLIFNEKEDILLMKNISSVLTESEVFYKNNERLGNIRVKFGNLKHGGVIHIIKRRMDKLIKHEGMNYDDAVKETSAILFLSLQNISNAPATKETDGRYAIYKDGIKTAIGKDKNGRYVVTGFNFNDTKQEAAVAIKSVNALYGYTPEFLDIYAQVGAAYASLNNNITQQNSPVNDNKSDYEKLLYCSAEINVNGKIRHCNDGLIKGFENAVSRLESCFAENSSLKNENARLKFQIECMNSKCEKLIQDNEELKKQALKNKIRPMGM